MWASLVAQLLKNLLGLQKTPGSDSWVRKIPWRRDRLSTLVLLSFPDGSDDKESACIVEDLGLIPRLGRFPGGGHGNHSSILAWRIAMDRGAWCVTVHGVAKSWTLLSDLAQHSTS